MCDSQPLRLKKTHAAQDGSKAKRARAQYALTRICLLKYIIRRGIGIRNHCRAKPPCDIGPAGVVATVRGRDRASTSNVAADRVEAPARAARGRFRGGHRGRTAPSLPAKTRTISGVGCLAGSVPPLLVGSHRCSRTASQPHGRINTNEGRQQEDNAAQAANITRRNEMKIKLTSVYVDNQDKA